MGLVVGVILAIATGILGRTAKFDRDRAFYPTITIVIATYFILFAAMGASSSVLIAESLFAVLFVALAIVGLRKTLWAAVFGLAAHGATDLFHGNWIPNPGVPEWWPPLEEKIRRCHQEEEHHPQEAEGLPPSDGHDEPLRQRQEQHGAQRVSSVCQPEHPPSGAGEPR